MAIKFNIFTGNFDLVGSGSSGTASIPQYSTDPASPAAQDAWVLKTSSGGSGGGKPYGLLAAITQPNTGGSSSYQFSYRTIEGTTKRVTLS